MAASFVSSSTANTGSAAASSLAINLPSSVTAGNSLLASIVTDGTPTVTPPSGWTLLKSQAQSTNLQTLVYFRAADGTEGSSYTWSFNASKQAAGLIANYSGSTGFAPASFGNANGTAASTTLPGGTVNNTYSGLMLFFWGTRSTAASTTITAASGYMGRADTCTTAANFIEAELQDSPKSLPIGGTGTQNSTASQTGDNYACVSLCLEDSHVNSPLQLDSFYGTSSITTTASIAVTTNYTNELLVLAAASETGSATVSSVSGGGLTWTRQGGISTQGGDCEVWYALAVSKTSNQTMTVNFSSSTSGVVCFFGVSGIDITSGTGSSAFGAANSANSAASSTPSVSLTTTRDFSLVFALENSSNATTGNGTAAGETQIKNHSTASVGSSDFFMQTSPAGISGSSVTMATNAATTDWNIYAFEIIRAQVTGSGTLELLGVGG